jgi:hypothetical protein
MNIETLSMAFRKAGTATSTGTAFPSLIPTVTEPTGDGVIKTTNRNDLLIVPLGLTNNGTYDMRITGWSSLGGGSTTVWVPCMIDQYVVVIGNTGGVGSNANLASTEKLADTITASTATTGDAVRRTSSPGGDLAGFAVVTRNAFERIQITYSGTGANALFMEL